MRPTREEIELAAYARWERRGCLHGFDREDWEAAEKDLTFARNYRWIARQKLEAERGATVAVGKPEGDQPRRCRYCEMAEPGASFEESPLLLPAAVGNSALIAWDECDDCRSTFAEHLEEPFEAFVRPWLEPWADLRAVASAGIEPGAHKALIKMGLGLLPHSELHHFGDTVEWINNPDHGRDAPLLEALGVRVYRTRAEIPSPFASLARRTDDSSPFPYLLFFLGTGSVVFQARLPLTPRDEDIDPRDIAGPELSMSLGYGNDYRPSESVVLSVHSRRPARRSGIGGLIGAHLDGSFSP